MTLNLALSEVPFPIRLRPAKPMSDEELEAFSERNSPLRMERNAHGEIVVMTPCYSITGKMNIRLSRLLDEWAEHDGRGVAFDSSAGFTLPDTSMLSPDASWMELSRWNALTDKQRHSFAPVCPDFIIELRSDTDRLHELRKKMELWIANGAQVAWLIDPLEKTITVYRPNESPEVYTDPTSLQGSGPIRSFELVLSRIWV